MINFLPREQQKKAKLAGIQRLVVTSTTVVLTLYIVAGAGWMGWWAYLARRESSVSLQVENLNREIERMAVKEGLVRQIAARLEVVGTALEEKKISGLIPQVLDERVVVSAWNYRLGGVYRLTVSAANPTDLEDYMEKLQKIYPNLKNLIKGIHCFKVSLKY